MTKDKLLKNSATPGIIALAILALSFRLPFKADDLIVGFGSVAALLGIATIEYRLNWKSFLGR